MTTQQENVSSQSYAIPNLAYDLITVIHEKSKGLEAFDQYLQDAHGNQEVADLFQQIRQQDQQNINQLTQQLQSVLSQSGNGSSGQ